MGLLELQFLIDFGLRRLYCNSFGDVFLSHQVYLLQHWDYNHNMHYVNKRPQTWGACIDMYNCKSQTKKEPKCYVWSTIIT